MRASSVTESRNLIVQNQTHNQQVNPYLIENCFSHSSTNCRNSLQKHLTMNQSSDELYERIKSPTSCIEGNVFGHPNANTNKGYSMLNTEQKETSMHQAPINDACDPVEEAVTRFDQENSADSDPESYLHSNSDLEENKNISFASIDNNHTISD